MAHPLHLMLDFETLGTNPDAVVLSLGAVLFTRDGSLGTWHWHFKLNPQIKLGQALDENTLHWWLEQSEEARTIFPKCQKFGVPVKAALKELAKIDGISRARVWGNGATFDVSIVENLYRRHKAKFLPWNFKNVRCYRTVKALHQIEAGAKRTGVHHDALDDAIFQADCLMNFFRQHPALDR